MSELPMAEMSVPETIELAIRHHEAGELQQAEPLYEQVLAQEPENADVLNRAGILAFQMGRHEIALDFVQRAAAVEGERADYQYNLGLMLRMTGRLDEAIAAFSKAIELQSDHAEAYNDLGMALASRGRLEEAIAAFQQALVFRSDFAQALQNLGNAQAKAGRLKEGIVAFRQAIAIQPDFFSAYTGLAGTLFELRRFDEAMIAYKNALYIKPDHAPCLNALGNALRETGQLAEAIEHYRRAIESRPDYGQARSNLILALQWSDEKSTDMVSGEIREFNDRIVGPFRKSFARHENIADPHRKIRIGYLSDQFYHHESAMVLDPLLRNHDLQNFEIYCYADVQSPDDLTRRFESYVDRLYITASVSDEQLAGQIRKDQIDILVDLKLHTEPNRLGVFAREPAPVQVSWLAYPGSTGLETIDYRLSDEILEPSTEKNAGGEEAVRLAQSFWVFDPMNPEPGVNELPALKNGYVTFGCLNHFGTITDRMWQIWLRILKAGGGRLVLRAPEGGVRTRIWEKFDRADVDPNRVSYFPEESRMDYLQAYHRIDLGLDTFPSNGQISTLDSLWMGVPVLTLTGKTPMARAGLSLLSKVDLAGFAARNEEEYVRLGAILSGNLPRLAEIRAGLRERLKTSPLMEGIRFARDVESAYRQIWQKWCEPTSM